MGIYKGRCPQDSVTRWRCAITLPLSPFDVRRRKSIHVIFRMHAHDTRFRALVQLISS